MTTIMNEQEIIKEVQRSLSILIEDEGVRKLMIDLVRAGNTPEQVANHVREIVIKHTLKSL